MLSAIVSVGVLSSFLGGVLGYAAIRFRVQGNPLAEKVEQILPQSQCGQCGFAGCKGYAIALTQDHTEIDRCAPGGQAVIMILSDLLGREPPRTVMAEKPPTVAVINESMCIGCTLCRQACPVDAIVGAAKQMHTIIRDECTGCELCIAPCPVDCINMAPLPQDILTWKWPYPESPM
ncbi:SoxR (2Fe-2S) reducing system protein RsxB [Gammaproteobacteria bacterium]